MRIVFCTHNAELEGAPLHIFRLATLFQRKGHTVEMHSPSDGPLIHLAKKNHLQTHICPALYKAETTQTEICRHVLRCQPDLIVINTILGARIVESVKNTCPNIPVEWLIHESECHHFIRLYSHIRPDIFSKADDVIFVSHNTKNIYAPWDTGNMHVIHNGIDSTVADNYMHTHDKNILREQYGIPQDAFVFSIIGSICLRKGQEEYIRSALHIMEEMPEKNIHFVIAGKNSAYHSYFEEALQPTIEKNVRHRFHVLAAQENPMGYFAITDVLVCNSFIESFPLVILEAMTFGLPILASGIYGITEQIIHRQSGLLHLAGHTTQLTNNMRTMIENPSLRIQLGANAKQRVLAHFKENVMFERYKELFLRHGIRRV